MSDPAVLDWDRIVHKNVRSSDGQDAGNVDAIDGDSVVIITDGARKEFKISKSQIDGYNGAEVFLKLTIAELEKHSITYIVLYVLIEAYSIQFVDKANSMIELSYKRREQYDTNFHVCVTKIVIR